MDYNQKRKEQSLRTEQAILHSARQLARTSGFDKVTVREICAHAGITTGAFYHHFRSKEELLDREFSSLDNFVEREAEASCGSVPEQLWGILSAYAAFMEEHGWELIAQYYERRLSEPDGTYRMDQKRYILKTIYGCLKKARQEGLLSSSQDEAWLAEFFFRHFRGSVIDWLLHQGRYSLMEKVEQDFLLFEKVFGSELCPQRRQPTVTAEEKEKAVARICRMEALYDLLEQGRRDNPEGRELSPELQEAKEILERYYTEGEWQHDYALDEAGLLPQDLKRGVLSQDGLYDLLF